jgi:hypothetical protein
MNISRSNNDNASTPGGPGGVGGVGGGGVVVVNAATGEKRERAPPPEEVQKRKKKVKPENTYWIVETWYRENYLPDIKKLTNEIIQAAAVSSPKKIDHDDFINYYLYAEPIKEYRLAYQTKLNYSREDSRYDTPLEDIINQFFLLPVDFFYSISPKFDRRGFEREIEIYELSVRGLFLDIYEDPILDKYVRIAYEFYVDDELVDLYHRLINPDDREVKLLSGDLKRAYLEMKRLINEKYKSLQQKAIDLNLLPSFLADLRNAFLIGLEFSYQLMKINTSDDMPLLIVNQEDTTQACLRCGGGGGGGGSIPSSPPLPPRSTTLVPP